MENICIFEDSGYENFLPLTYSRPVFELRCGFKTLREKIEELFPNARFYLSMRDYLVPLFSKKSLSLNDFRGGDLLFINGRMLLKQKPDIKKEGIYYFGDEVAFIYVKEKSVENLDAFNYKDLEKMRLEKFKVSDVKLLNYPWDILKENGSEIRREFSSFLENQNSSSIDVDIQGDKKQIFIGKNVEIEKYTLFDTRKGPIYIGDDTTIEAFSRISGPAYVGKKCLIKRGRLQNSSIGDVCKVGGEIEDSILHGYSNKQHYGFLGHAYVGEWVNLGAGTSNSDLKDTYGTIRYNVSGKAIDSKEQFFGCVIGDNSKSSIGTMIYTGKKIGFAAHIHGVVSEDVPSFCMWAKPLGSKPKELYLESAIRTYSRASKRRGVTLTKDYEDLIKKIFQLTKDERKSCSISSEKFSLK